MTRRLSASDRSLRGTITFTTEAVIAWLDAGQPDPDQAADRIGNAVHGIIGAIAGD